MTLIVGNLDCEARLAALATGRRYLQPRLAALRALSDAASLLRCFARPGDRLWAPLPIDPGRLPQLPGVPQPALCCGELDLAAEEGILAWSGGPELPFGEPAGAGRRGDATLRGRLDSQPVAPAAIAAAVNHRGFALATARNLDCALPGSRMVGSIEDLRRHLAEGGAIAGDRERWVVKAPFSAAGRLRFVAPQGLDPEASLEQPEVVARIERLLRLQGPLLFEPWMRRVDDWACLLWVGSDATELLGIHRLLVGRDGRFVGVSDDPDGREVPAPGAKMPAGLSAADRRRLTIIAEGVAAALRERGYRGPAGLDAWRYRTGQEIRLHPLGEINARLTFGWVWRGWRERLVAAGLLASDARSGLRLGRALPADSPTVVPLLLPGAESPGGAWLERGTDRSS